MTRVSEEHTWPLRPHSALASVLAAVSRSMSSRTTAADFPPSSSVQRAIRSPHNDAMRRPAAVDPVNVILSTSGLVTSNSDTSRSAVTTLNTPAGRPICSAASANTLPAPGASGADLSTTVQPASSAGPILWQISATGAFQGMIAPTTPTGSRTRRPNLPPPVGAHSSSNAKVSASAAYPARAPEAIRPEYCDVEYSTPDSRGHSCDSASP